MSQISIAGASTGTATFTIESPATSTNRTLTLPDGAGTIVANGANGSIVSGTAVASTSGTSIDFTGIPSWVKKITVMFNAVSTNGTSRPLIQLGDSGGIENSGYISVSGSIAGGTADTTNSTAGFSINSQSATNTLSGSIVFSFLGSNTWTCFGSVAATAGSNQSFVVSGRKELSDTLTQVRITTVNGTDTFDAGSINIFYE
jgi:hypothetical protein